MGTVADIIRDALGHLRVIDADEAIEAGDHAGAIRALNLMMRRWEASGIALGWADVTAPEDVMPVPPEAEESIGYNLALRLRARYGATLDQDVIEHARDGKSALMADVASADAARLTYDLPRGDSEGGGDFFGDVA